MAVALVAGVLLLSRLERFPFRPSGSPPGGVTYLVLGSDSRRDFTSAEDRKRYGGVDATPGERADVIMAVRVDDDGATRLLVLSRDLLVLGPTGAPVRLAETMLEGPQDLVDSLCGSLGLGVDHVVVIHMDGVRGVVDAIGGVEVETESPVRDQVTGLDLPGGAVRLDGDEVLQFVGARNLEHYRGGRWRLGADATARPERASSVFRTIGGRLDLSPWSPVRTARRVWAGAGGVALDDGFGPSDATTLRTALDALGRAEEITLPTEVTRGGLLSVEELDSGAGSRLSAFDEAGRSAPTCAAPAFAAAVRPGTSSR